MPPSKTASGLLTRREREIMNAVFALDDGMARRGVAAHSSGNHGTALARAAELASIAPLVIGASRKSFVGKLTGRAASSAELTAARGS